MICALSLNPCVDKMVTVDGFNYGGMNRIKELRRDGSGKGVNIVIACNQMGRESRLVGFGAKGEDLVKTRLAAAEVPCSLIESFEELRVNTKVKNIEDGVITEINEAGSKVEQTDIESVKALCIKAAQQSDFMVLTGSMPPGCPSTLYGDMIRDALAVAPHCRCVLDAEGEAFSEGLKARPYMVKPNRYELELYMGRELSSLTALKEAGQSLLEKGIQVVLVSMGSDGAMLVSAGGCWYAPALDIDVVSPVGAGDSMVVGMLCALEDGMSTLESFRRAVAAATSAVTTEGTELIDYKRYEELVEKVELEVIYD